MDFDVIISGGTVFSGDLEPGVKADVGIRDGRVMAVGPISAKAETVVDATGRFVAPGFIDIHSHSDYTLLVDPRAMSAIHQGVTLEVIGNCGFGCAPVADPLQAIHGIYGFDGTRPIGWRNFAGYFAALEASQPAVNVMSLAPAGQLRRASGIDLEVRTDAAGHRRLARLLDICMDEGCCGFSTGLEYPVERSADEAEVTALAAATARAGGFYATHTRARGAGALPAIDEAIRTARGAGVQLQISHIIPRSTSEGEIEGALSRVERARTDGVDVGFDMHTRAFGTTMLNTLLPPWIASLGEADRRASLGDASVRDRIRPFPSIISSLADWSRVVLLDTRLWPEYGRQSLAEIGEKRRQDPFHAALDLLMREDASGRPMMVILPCYTTEQQADFFAHPDCIPASDATTLAPDGPLADAVFHGAYSWASWFYRFMVRETRRIAPPEAIHRMTGKPAQVLGLRDRGRLMPGMAADIAVFDPETFGERSEVFTPNRLAVGMSDVFVNGVHTLRAGAPTGQRAGRVLRGRSG
jgi:N-acyl-D-amino-acid deacylase